MAEANAPAPAPADPATVSTASPASTAVPVPATSDAPLAGSSAVPSATPISDAGLAEAVRRDLGMTLAEFDAAGALARRAADAAPSLRALPGYVGISLSGGKIAVEGSGPELRARVAELNQPGPADFVLAAPAAAAVVPSAAELLASSTQQLFEAYVREVGTAGLQAVTYTDGHFVIRAGGTNTAQSVPASGAVPAAGLNLQPAGEPGTKMSAAEFVARYANVTLEQGSRVTTEEDFFGGQGYIVDGRTLCSAGFGAFSPAGEPLVLTAGHCAGDGAAKQAEIENPAGAPAAGGAGSGPAAGILGTFGFSQFGGSGNSKVASDGTNVGTDITVLQGVRSGLDLQPAVTRWDNPADPGPTSVKIVGTVAPFQGQPVCRSGRTTGWRCGAVDSVGIWAIPGPNSLPPDYDNDLRAVRGFDSTSVTSGGGDSGGPWISGNFAVGLHTGAESTDEGVQTRAIATTLEDAMGQVPGGVQLQLFLAKPTLAAASNATVTAGEPITGHIDAGPASVVAPNSKVRITVLNQKPGQTPGKTPGQKDVQPLEVPVDASGNWQFPAPSSAGPFKFSAETVNGFSGSGAVALSVDVSSLAAPAITSPVDGQPDGPGLTAIETIKGTGEAGGTVRLSGDLTGTGLVDADGRWSINVADQPVFGIISVTAVLTAPGEVDSPAVTRTYSVIPPAPAVSNLRDGKHLRQDALPATISGMAIDGADVAVAVDGVAVDSVQAGPGSTAAQAALEPGITQTSGGSARWSVPFPAELAAGAHTLTVTQAIDGVTSLPGAVAFVVDAAPASEGTPAGTPGSGKPGGGTPATPRQPAVPQQPANPAGAPAVPAKPVQASAPPSDTTVSVGGTAPDNTAPGNTPGTADQLASTGAGGLLPVAGLGAGALLLGAAFVAFGRRRAVR